MQTKASSMGAQWVPWVLAVVMTACLHLTVKSALLNYSGHGIMARFDTGRELTAGEETAWQAAQLLFSPGYQISQQVGLDRTGHLLDGANSLLWGIAVVAATAALRRVVRMKARNLSEIRG